jgi:hypothetical protein
MSKDDGNDFTYQGQLPVEEDWVERHVGDYVTFEIPISIYKLIHAGGIEEVNAIVDHITGVVLSDLSYGVGTWDAEDSPDPFQLLMRVSGIVEEF